MKRKPCVCHIIGFVVVVVVGVVVVGVVVLIFLLAAQPADQRDNHLKAGRQDGLMAGSCLASKEAASRRAVS